MESILITPKNEVALNSLKSLLKEMKGSFISKKIAEEDVFYPELEKINLQTEKDKQNGKLIELNTDNLDEFWKQVEKTEI